MSLSRLLDPALVVLLAMGLGLALITRWRRRSLDGSEPSDSKPIATTPRRARAGHILLWAAWIALWLLASPWVSARLTGWIEMPAADEARLTAASAAPEHTAMVVLSGGIRAPRPGVTAVERLTDDTLARVLGAARIYREHPVEYVIVSGRAPEPGAGDLARGMRDLLIQLGVPEAAIVVEDESVNTRENAERSAAVAKKLSIRTVILVTSAVHMPRAVRDFAAAGVDVIPAPVDYQGTPATSVERWFPSSSSLLRSHRAIHELLGRLKP